MSLSDPQTQMDDLKRKLDDLTQQVNDFQLRPINLTDILLDMKRPLDEVRGIYRVVSVAPTAPPIDTFDGIQMYTNGATFRLYWFDWNASVWHYVTATA